ncbi:MAG: beta-ketoacyl-[acyl-carrier-protein] synthase II, partial [Anaerolineae bacterium]|nr:beta-ketoacyl-[acyl-carrier-protein] synthase II [Anaerolineae bacterium]
EFAQSRGANILCEVVGYGASADAYHVTAPDENGMGATRSMRRALAKAGLTPDDVDYINAHGTSTQLNDKVETLAIKRVFGERAYQIPISSTKSMTGHLIGAAGAVEAVAAIQTILTGTVHPTINYETPDPECDLDYVPNTARRAPVKVALSNSFGFGGHNATLVFRAYEA